MGRAALCHSMATLLVINILWTSPTPYCILQEAWNTALTSPPLCPSVSYLVPVDLTSGQVSGGRGAGTFLPGGRIMYPEP